MPKQNVEKRLLNLEEDARSIVEQAVREAIALEREECARLADQAYEWAQQHKAQCEADEHNTYWLTEGYENLAEKIRERGKG